MTVYRTLRALVCELDRRAAEMDDGTLPPELRAMLARCREDLAVILAATEPHTLAVLDGMQAPESFEALRGLVRGQ